MAKQNATQDRNFDDLAGRFKKNIYGGLKGAVRLAVLQRDFAEAIPHLLAADTSLRILDAGGGQGQFSLSLAKAGHKIVLCDISAEMLKLAREQAENAGLEQQVTLVHCALQDLPAQLDDTQFDLVLCHAVMEWMAEPHTLLPCLYQYLKPGGWLSLTYYNRHSLIFKNLLRTNFKKVIAQDFKGARGSLTPINPLEPEQVDGWLKALPLTVVARSGIRVFHDYILDAQQREHSPEDLIKLELALSRQEPYRSLGRYIHVLGRRQDPVSTDDRAGHPGVG